MNKHVVIFETDAFGHQEQYIRALTENFKKKYRLRITFVIHPVLIKRLYRDVDKKGFIGSELVDVISLDNNELAKLNVGPLWKRALYKWNLAKKYSEIIGATHLHFLYLDHMQLPLALHQKFGENITISGILFRPTIHYTDDIRVHPSLAEHVRDFRKKWMYRAMLSNSNLKHVFSLDKYFVEYVKNEWKNEKKKISYLPDPLPITRSIDDKNLVTEFWIPSGRKIFLLFGALQRRKGIFKVLEALAKLPPLSQKKIALIYAGKVDQKVEAELKIAVQNFKNSSPQIWFRLEDRFLDQKELQGLIQKSDVILAPYQRFVGSSGILIWAAIYAKPVITQDYGLIGRLVREYGLGRCIDTTNINLLAEVIEQAVSDQARIPLNIKGAQSFIMGRDPSLFQETILKKLEQIS